MSLPQRPWPEDRIRALYRKSKRLMERSVHPFNKRLFKRSERIANRSFALWFQARGIDPHSPAIVNGLPTSGEGTRR